MTFAEFKALVEEVKEKWPALFEMPIELGMKMEIASTEDIKHAQEALNAILPEEYVQFLREYGGGFFASCGDIYSVEPQGDWHLGSYQPHYNNQNFVAFANNGCGDSYGFIVSEGKCQPEVYFWDHESGGEISKTKFEDFFEFIAAQLRERIL